VRGGRESVYTAAARSCAIKVFQGKLLLILKKKEVSAG